MNHSGGDIKNGGGYVCVGAGDLWELCCECKTALKMKIS